MNAQETFDIGAKHLLTQMKKSLADSRRGGTLCAYRGNNGLKCAAGIFIPDSKYNFGMEGKNWNKICTMHSEAADWGDYRMIVRLQNLHDLYSVEAWTENLIIIGKHLGVDTSAIETFINQKDNENVS